MARRVVLEGRLDLGEFGRGLPFEEVPDGVGPPDNKMRLGPAEAQANGPVRQQPHLKIEGDERLNSDERRLCVSFENSLTRSPNGVPRTKSKPATLR